MVGCRDESILDFTIDTGELVRPLSFGRTTIGVGILIIALLAFVLYYFLPKIMNPTSEQDQSVLVFPFNNYLGTDTLEYFVAGMHDAFITDIGQISALNVKSKTTANAIKNTNKTIPQIAEELGVNKFVEGAVLCLGDSVCLQVRLFDQEENELWIHDFKVERSQILDLYNMMAKEISSEIGVILTPQEERRLAVVRTVDNEVYDLYLKSHMYWDQLDNDALNKAKEFLTYAIEKDPDWAPLYAGLANVWIAIGQMGHESPEVVVENVYENLNKALEKDPTHWESHLSNAHLAFNIEWNWEKAEKEFLTAIDLNPNDAMARLHYSHLLMVLGRISEALEQGKLGINLDPLNPFIQSLYSVVLVASGDYPTALMYCEKSLSIDPDNFFTLTILELVSFANGNYERTIDAGLQWLPLGDEIKTTVKQIYKEEGFIIAQNEIIIALEKYAKNNYYIPPDMAMRYVWVTNVEKALDWLERGYEVHDQQMTYIYTFFGANESIKDNPRFIAILEKMNLPLP
jgi:TolB-like protein/Tfp pilus assembly protein PilF